MEDAGGRWLRWRWAAPLAVTAAAVRLAGVGREPFWLDEIFTFQESSGDPASVLASVARDAHPPLYFLGVWAWRRLAGDPGPGPHPRPEPRPPAGPSRHPVAGRDG